MSIERWTNAAHRTLQYAARSTPEREAADSILLIVHGDERPIDVTLPRIPGVAGYTSLWSSADERPQTELRTLAPGETLPLSDTCLHLFRVDGA